jgi:hypothetical protein
MNRQVNYTKILILGLLFFVFGISRNTTISADTALPQLEMESEQVVPNVAQDYTFTNTSNIRQMTQFYEIGTNVRI